MSRKSNTLRLHIGLGLCGICASVASEDVQKDLRQWLILMHKKQVELLKIEWGQPGFCGEQDRDYNPTTRTCGKRGKPIQRRY